MDESRERERERDRSLRRAVLQGDSEAWNTWYRETFDDVYAFVIWRSGGSREHVDDVVQETWMAAVRQVRQFDPARASFKTWMRAIASNILCDFRKRRPILSIVEFAVEPASFEGADRPITIEEERERITSVLCSLPNHYENVLRAKYLDQQSVDEIAVSRKESPKAVESLLTRARQAFRELFVQVDGSDGSLKGSVR